MSEDLRYAERCWQWSDYFTCNSLLQHWVDNVIFYFLTVNVIICMETFLTTLSTNRYFLKMWIILLKMI